MKRFLTILCLLLLFGCGGKPKNQGAASSPGGAETNAAANNAPAAQQAATNGAYNKIGTNVNSERAANQALTRAATNSPNIGGNTTAPGGTAIHSGTATGERGATFWIYVALDVAFLVWLVLAIRKRVHKPAAAH